LHCAILNNNVKILQTLLDFERVNPNTLARDGRQPLLLATEADVLKLLLDSERLKKPNMINSVGFTVLHRAVISSDIKRVEILLAHKRIDPDITARNGMHVIALSKRFDILRLLLDSKKVTNPDLNDNDGYTAFHRTVIKNDIQRVEMMLSCGLINPNSLTSDGKYLAITFGLQKD
jgi:ankyrin repeat protein